LAGELGPLGRRYFDNLYCDVGAAKAVNEAVRPHKSQLLVPGHIRERGAALESKVKPR
jgi:hypothetical protein